MRLHIDALGLVLPPRRTVRSLIEQAGGNACLHEGWDNVCVAADEQHPSDIATSALTQALDDAKLDASELDLVLAVGVSRDYPPSWSMAAEAMRRCRVSPRCLGFDLTSGCMGMLVGLQTAMGLLAVRGGGRAALVTAERWSSTVDRGRDDTRPLWGHSDGGAALIVSSGSAASANPLATFHGAEFANHADYNGLVLVKYGGTRFPEAPAGQREQRVMAPIPPSEIWATYEKGYGRAIGALRARIPGELRHVICNQVSPKIVSMIERVAGVPAQTATVTGHAYGHVGAADVVLGLSTLLEAKQFDGPTLVATSVPYSFGAGLITPGAH